MSGGDSSESEWEDVEPVEEHTVEQLLALDDGGTGGPSSSSAKPPPAGSLEIVLQNKRLCNKGKHKSVNYFEKALAAFNRELYCNLHKVNLLCLLSRGLFLSRQCDDIIMKSLLLSIIGAEKKELVYSDINLYTQVTILKLLNWFSKRTSSLQDQISEQMGSLNMTTVQLLVAILRAIGLRTRLVMVLNPMSFKPPSSQSRTLMDPISKETDDQKGSVTDGKDTSSTVCVGEVDSGTIVKIESGANLEDVSEKATVVESHEKAENKRKRKRSTEMQSSAKKAKRHSSEQRSTVVNKRSPYFKKKSKKKCLERCDEIEQASKKSRDRDTDYQPDIKSLESNIDISLPSDDEDFVQSNKKKRHSKTTPPAKKLKKAAEKSHKSKRNSVSEPTLTASPPNTSGDSDVKLQNVEDTASWAEVYLHTATTRDKNEKRWLSVHLLSASVGQSQLCEKHCTIPLHYVVAFETGESDIVRDVTARYSSGWCTNTRKHRTSEEWWTESLRPFEPTNLEENKAEEEDILSMLYAQPLPTVISDYKNHPLYALRRHLLKFDAIYPEDSQIIGYCKGEPVYARECVRTLHTRETWLKEGRVVRRGEEAYNVVKARPKKGQSVLGEQNNTVEVFGRWQTEEYMPPPVINGKVPRNEYGNLELFKPSMLPVGAAHIPIQGVQRVARKLGIDYAPAVTGWDFHSGHCHPVIDGVVVAEEFKDILLEAWQQEEQLIIEREIKKREKCVTERWKKFVRGILVRERVKRTYSMV